LVSASVGVKLIVGFILEIFRSIAQPVEGSLGALLVLLAVLLLLRAQKKMWAKKQLWWDSIVLVLGAIVLVICWQYDAVLLAMSPKDFHLTIWRWRKLC
jgi:hypothetical protein